MSFSLVSLYLDEDPLNIMDRIRGKTDDIFHLTQVAAEIDQMEMTPTMNELLRLILVRFERKILRPMLDGSGVDSLQIRSKSWDIVQRVEKGAIFSALRQKIAEYVRKYTLSGSSFPEYMVLIRYYFCHRVLSVGSRWEVELHEDHSEPVVVVTEEVPQQATNFRDSASRLIQSFESTLQVTQEKGVSTVEALGQIRRVIPNRVEEDKAIDSILHDSAVSALIPFKPDPQLAEASNYKVLAKNLPEPVRVIENAKIDYENDVEAGIEIVDTSKPAVVTVAGSKFKYVMRPLRQARKILSYVRADSHRAIMVSDASAFKVTEKYKTHVIQHSRSATFFNFLNVLPGVRSIPPFRFAASLPFNFEPKGEGGELGLFKFITALIRRPKTLAELRTILAYFSVPEVPALGKYLFLIGAKRIVDEYDSMWEWDESAVKKMFFHYDLHKGNKQVLDYAAAYGSQAVDFYSESYGNGAEYLRLIAPIFERDCGVQARPVPDLDPSEKLVPPD